MNANAVAVVDADRLGSPTASHVSPAIAPALVKVGPRAVQAG